jgi:hypothetical protein
MSPRRPCSSEETSAIEYLLSPASSFAQALVSENVASAMSKVLTE